MIVALWFVGMPVSLFLGGLFYFAADSWVDFSADQLFDEFDYWIFAVMFVLAVTHERCHALLHPGWGLSPLTIYGCLPKGLALYAHYDGPTTRTRAIAIMIAPFIALSVMPLLVACFYQPVAVMASAIAILNAAFSGLDVANTIVMIWGVPVGALVQNKGWRSYWRIGLPASPGANVKGNTE